MNKMLKLHPTMSEYDKMNLSDVKLIKYDSDITVHAIVNFYKGVKETKYYGVDLNNQGKEVIYDNKLPLLMYQDSVLEIVGLDGVRYKAVLTSRGWILTNVIESEIDFFSNSFVRKVHNIVNSDNGYKKYRIYIVDIIKMVDSKHEKDLNNNSIRYLFEIPFYLVSDKNSIYIPLILKMKKPLISRNDEYELSLENSKVLEKFRKSKIEIALIPSPIYNFNSQHDDFINRIKNNENKKKFINFCIASGIYLGLKFLRSKSDGKRKQQKQ